MTFWEKDHPGVAFFHNPKAPFPTLWTPLPMHAPLLYRLGRRPQGSTAHGKREGLKHNALATVQPALGRKEDPVAWLIQDREADLYARGGYSYVKVGGAGTEKSCKDPWTHSVLRGKKKKKKNGAATDAQEAE